MKRTPEKEAAFLAALATTGGNVTRAAKAAGISHTQVYEWRKEDEQFAARWKEAQAIGADVLEDEARRRAHDGVPEPIYHQGICVDTVTKYSDTLMIFLLKGQKPDVYRERISQELTGKDGAPLLSDAERAAKIAAILAAAKAREGAAESEEGGDLC